MINLIFARKKVLKARLRFSLFDNPLIMFTFG